MKRRLAVGLALAFTTLAAAGVGTSLAAKSATTLTMWSYDNQDPGLEPVLKQLSKQFEASHPGVKINLVFKDFNSLVNTVPRALASGSGPDVTEGNQGYQTDAQLVKAKLILPLDKYVKKYGWKKLYSSSTWGMFRWTPDGKSFGKGPIWGLAQTGQNVVAFYNKAKLRRGRRQPRLPTTFAAFDKLLAQLSAKLPKDEPVIEEGNNEGYGFIHLFGGIWGAYEKPAASATGSTTCRARATTPRARSRRSRSCSSGRRRATSTRTTTPISYDVSASRVRQGQGRLLDRRRLGLDDHQDRPRQGRRRHRACLPGRAAYTSIGGLSGPVAHLVRRRSTRTSAPSGSTT